MNTIKEIFVRNLLYTRQLKRRGGQGSCLQEALNLSGRFKTAIKMINKTRKDAIITVR